MSESVGVTPLPNERGKLDGSMIAQKRPSLSKPRTMSSSNSFRKSTHIDQAHSTSTNVAGDEEVASSDGDVTEQVSPASSPSATGFATISSNTTHSLNSALDFSPEPEAKASAADLKEVTGGHDTVRQRRGVRSRRPPRAPQRPNSLSLSESETSMVTHNPIRRAERDTRHSQIRGGGPQISPPFSSAPSTDPNDVFSERQAETRSDLSWSPEYPEYALASQPPPISPTFDPRFVGAYPLPQRYPVPQYAETPQGPAPLPFFQAPPRPNSMAAAARGFPRPPAERSPLRGYELVAARLTGDVGGTPIKPLYRRFDAVNHRILLSLQDQISVLEEELAGMDDTDARTRQAGIPASGREERESNHSFHVAKSGLMVHLSDTLQAYNTLLASFKDIHRMPAPTAIDIQDYRAFLAAERPIDDVETMFLNAPDLILLEANQTRVQGDEQRKADGRARGEEGGSNNRLAPEQAVLIRGALQELALALMLPAVSPLVTFSVIRDFAGRMTIVILCGIISTMVVLRSGTFNALATTQGTQDLLTCGGVYIGVMAVLSWMLR